MSQGSQTAIFGPQTYDLTPPPPSKSSKLNIFFSLDFQIPLPPLFGNVMKNLSFFKASLSPFSWSCQYLLICYNLYQLLYNNIRKYT